jgi:hypothetical protein
VRVRSSAGQFERSQLEPRNFCREAASGASLRAAELPERATEADISRERRNVLELTRVNSTSPERP